MNKRRNVITKKAWEEQEKNGRTTKQSLNIGLEFWFWLQSFSEKFGEQKKKTPAQRSLRKI